MVTPTLISCQSIGKAFGERPLFEGLSLSVHEGDRVGLIGPNGAGKSTLLKILADVELPDTGECTRRRNLRVGYVPQRPIYPADASAAEVVAKAAGSDDHRAQKTLSHAGFADPSVTVGTLSGGWTTRLALACALVGEPELLLLDEPTNHLDLDSILWLESLLQAEPPAFVVISHDRYFLQNVAQRMVDIDPIYPQGMLAVQGAYAELLEVRDELLANQSSYQQTLANRVRREVAWLRRGAKARTSKAKARIDAAGQAQAELERSRARTRAATTKLELNASGRKTKRLWYGQGLTKRFESKTIVDDLELLLTPGMRLGVVGPIGSGKSTLLRMIVGELKPDAGKIRKVDDLRVVYFDQNRRELDKHQTLKRALAPEGDSVIYRGQSVHVISWAKRFLFRREQLEQDVARLSGGEQARVVLARLMLQPADLLVLDEPTNDLDIHTLEVLEESLLDFPGALVLVSHDRHLIHRVTTELLALDGRGGVQRLADYHQWQAHRQTSKAAKKDKQRKPSAPSASQSQRPQAKRLGYLEQREWDGLEARVAAAEAELAQAQASAADPSIATDAQALQARLQQVEQAQQEVDRLYERWVELEAKQNP